MKAKMVAKEDTIQVQKESWIVRRMHEKRKVLQRLKKAINKSEAEKTLVLEVKSPRPTLDLLKRFYFHHNYMLF